MFIERNTVWEMWEGEAVKLSQIEPLCARQMVGKLLQEGTVVGQFLLWEQPDAVVWLNERKNVRRD